MTSRQHRCQGMATPIRSIDTSASSSSRLETAGLVNTLLLEAYIAELAASQIVQVLSLEIIRNGADVRRFPPWRWHIGVEKAVNPHPVRNPACPSATSFARRSQWLSP